MFISRRSLLAGAGASAIPLLTWIDELRAQVGPRLRPSCYSSSGTTHLATLRAGVAAMKALPSTDARNWLNIANIHIYYLLALLPYPDHPWCAGPSITSQRTCWAGSSSVTLMSKPPGAKRNSMVPPTSLLPWVSSVHQPARPSTVVNAE